MGLPLALYFLCLHYFRPIVAILAFLHTVHRFASSLFLNLFRPVYFFRTHFMSPWAIHSCHLGSMAFSCLLTLVCPCYWAFSLTRLAKKWASTFSPLSIWNIPAVYMWIKDFSVLFWPFFFSSFPSQAFLNSGPQLMCVSFLSRHEQCYLFKFPSLVVILKCSLASLISFLIWRLTHRLPSLRF